MNYEIIIHYESHFCIYNESKHCHTMDDATRTFRYYVGRPNVTVVLLFQNMLLIKEWHKGGMNDD